MSEPRPVVVTLAEVRGLTVLEVVRACSLAGVRQSDMRRMIETLGRTDAPPEELERGATLLYALAYQYRRRDEPELTWEEAQTWRITLDLETRDELAEAEAEAVVQASLASGLPPDAAGGLSMAELDAYRRARGA